MAERRIRPIGDDEDECDESPPVVGSGCASLTPDDDTRGNLDHAAKVVLRLKRAGAVYVKIGDVEVSFQEPTSSGQDGKQ